MEAKGGERTGRLRQRDKREGSETEIREPKTQRQRPKERKRHSRE